MEEELISFETAKLAKEVGFNWQCYHHFDADKVLQAHYEENESSTDVEFRVDLEDLLDTWNNFKSEACSAPTQSLLAKWLREVHNIFICIKIGFGEGVWYTYHVEKLSDPDFIIDADNSWNTYEKALEVGLLQALKLIKT